MLKQCTKCSQTKPISDFSERKERRIGSRPACKSCRAEYQRQYKANNPAKCMLHRARTRAKKKGLEFNITENDIIIPDICPVLGIKLEYKFEGKQDCSPSLDRINSDLGYIKGNVQVISDRANTLKNNATIEELLLVVEHMSRT